MELGLQYSVHSVPLQHSHLCSVLTWFHDCLINKTSSLCCGEMSSCIWCRCEMSFDFPFIWKTGFGTLRVTSWSSGSSGSAFLVISRRVSSLSSFWLIPRRVFATILLGPFDTVYMILGEVREPRFACAMPRSSASESLSRLSRVHRRIVATNCCR